MTRERVHEGSPWVMRCDRPDCTTTSEPFPTQPDLAIFADLGWFIAKRWGDRCPACVAAGLMPEHVEPMPGLPSPVDVVRSL